MKKITIAFCCAALSLAAMNNAGVPKLKGTILAKINGIRLIEAPNADGVNELILLGTRHTVMQLFPGITGVDEKPCATNLSRDEWQSIRHALDATCCEEVKAGQADALKVVKKLTRYLSLPLTESALEARGIKVGRSNSTDENKALMESLMEVFAYFQSKTE